MNFELRKAQSIVRKPNLKFKISIFPPKIGSWKFENEVAEAVVFVKNRLKKLCRFAHSALRRLCLQQLEI
ncbi:MAG: hypothetical protein LBO71_05660, partial [Prevotellaceae bacterium]|nr:hypothetical protein [Prevotellaceae bacterium]